MNSRNIGTLLRVLSILATTPIRIYENIATGRNDMPIIMINGMDMIHNIISVAMFTTRRGQVIWSVLFVGVVLIVHVFVGCVAYVAYVASVASGCGLAPIILSLVNILDYSGMAVLVDFVDFSFACWLLFLILFCLLLLVFCVFGYIPLPWVLGFSLLCLILLIVLSSCC